MLGLVKDFIMLIRLNPYVTVSSNFVLQPSLGYTGWDRRFHQDRPSFVQCIELLVKDFLFYRIGWRALLCNSFLNLQTPLRRSDGRLWDLMHVQQWH